VTGRLNSQWLLFLCLVTGPGLLVAQRPTQVGPKIRLTVRSNIQLEPITASELMGGAAPTVPFDGQDPGLTFQPLTREVLDLWSVRIPPSLDNAPLLVSYQLIANNGVEGALSHLGSPGSMVLCIVNALPPVDIGGPPGPRILQGGIRLEIDPVQVDQAGSYGGTLVVEVTRP